MDRLGPPVRRRAFGTGGIDRVQSPWRANSVPYISIMLGSLLPIYAVADVMPAIPPIGFLIFLCWRVMRPGLMPIWVGVPLGAFDDLFSGQPFGSAILLWSITMIVLEIIDARFPWRGFAQDWLAAGIGLLLYIIAAMVVSGSTISAPLLLAIIPQIVISILLYPLFARIIALLDRFRLSRARRL